MSAAVTPRRVGVLGLVLLGLAAPTSAWSQREGDELTRLFQQGVDAYRLGDYATARDRLERARALDGKLAGPHRFLAAVAKAEQRWADCLDSARAALLANPSSSEADATRALHAECRVGAGRPAFAGEMGAGAAIAVTSNVPGATVSLGGLRFGATPLSPRAVAAGVIEVRADKPGWITGARTVELVVGIVTDVDLVLEPDLGAGTGAEVVPPAVEVVDGALQVPAAVLALRPSITVDGAAVTAAGDGRLVLPGGVHEVIIRAPGRERWRRRVRITRGLTARPDITLRAHEATAGRRRGAALALASAGVLVGAGAVSYLLGHAAAEDARDAWRRETTRPTTVPLAESALVAPVQTRADIEAMADRADRWGLISTGAYAAALVAGGVGAYLLLSARPAERDGVPPPWALAPVLPHAGDGAVGAIVTLGGAL